MPDGNLRGHTPQQLALMPPPSTPGTPSGWAPPGPGTLGRAVQIDPIKPTLKAPGTTCCKPKYDEPPSNLAVKFNLHH